MAKLSISEASRVAGVACSTLHRAVRQGRLSLAPDGQVDTAELLRAGYTLQGHTRQARNATLQDATPLAPEALQAGNSTSTLLMEALERERALLQQQLDATRELLQSERQTAQDRERRAADREALLLQMLHDAHQQNQRLLDAPRAAPPAAADVVRELLRRRPYTDLPPAEASATPLPLTDDYRGLMRQRVLQALAGYPEGRTRVEIEREIGAPKSLGDVLQGMRRAGVIVRRGRGVYGLPGSG